MKWCWHRWDVFVDRKSIPATINVHTRKTKICRKCGEKRIKEKVW